MTMQVGELLQYKEHVLQVRQSEENACTHCFGRGKNNICTKMSCCHGGLYFKKLSNYEVRQVKKQGKNINKID